MSDESHYELIRSCAQVVVAPELAKFDQVLPKAKSVVDSIEVLDDEGEREAWQFDPATGANRS